MLSLPDLRKSLRSYVLMILVLSTCPAHATSAKDYFRQGQKAESRNDLVAAFTAYEHAHQADPEDVRYLASFDRLRPFASMAYLKEGEEREKEGDIQGAMEKALHAIAIDETNQMAPVVLERLKRESIEGKVLSAASSPRMSPEDLRRPSAPVPIKRLDVGPITLHMTEDTRNIYLAFGKISGLNILFDPDLPARRIAVDVTNENMQDALRVIQRISRTFVCPVTAHTIFIAADTRVKRTEYETQALQTFYLANVSQQNDLNEVLTAVRNLFGGDPSFKVFGVPSQNAITVRGTPDQLYLTKLMIDDLDKPHAEVVFDISILQVSRDKLRNMGITLPSSIGLGLQTTSTSSSSSDSSSSSTSGLSLNDVAHLKASNVSVTIGQATLNMLLNDSDTRILQNPRMRASDGQKATIKIGSRIPVATGSYSSTTSTTTSSLVNTQYQYIDVGVNVDIQPTIHSNHDVTVKIKIEVSSQTGTSDIGGISEPIIGQKTLEQTIRLTEGEVNLMGGILEKDDTRTVSGTPGLGELPLLKYLFSSQKHEVVHSEVIFAITPRIIRMPQVGNGSTSVVDTGTSQTIEIRRDPPATVTLPSVPAPVLSHE